MTVPWYVSAFGAHYNDLYSHRNDRDARRAVEFLHGSCGLSPLSSGLTLDLCCGSGRHCLQWAERAEGLENIVGLDLSENLLRDAAQAALIQEIRLALTRGDMRRLPFRDSVFGLVLNLFTSFGYFERDAENMGVFREAARVLTPQVGRFVFDHMNPPFLREHLRPESTRSTPAGVVARERRSIDEARSRVSKRIEFVARGQKHELLESVRFYERDEIEEMAGSVGIRLEAVFGDFDGSPLTASSPRAIYLMRRES